MSNGENRGFIRSARECLVGAGLLFLLVAGTAQAQVATGTVTCDLISPDSQGIVTAEKVVYSVEYNLNGNTVVGRWGAGKDITYGWGTVLEQTGKKGNTLTTYFYSLSDPIYVFEQLYSETGIWKLQISTANNTMSITGTSYAVVEMGAIGLFSGTCTWALKGPAPVM